MDKRRLIRTLLTISVVVACFYSRPVEAQTSIEFCRDQYARYIPSERRLVILDQRGDVVRELESNLDPVTLRGQSPSCRFLIGSVPNAAGWLDIIVWDAMNGGRYHVFTDIPTRLTCLYCWDWDTTDSYAVMTAYHSTWLLNFLNKTNFKLTDSPCGFVYPLFDLQHGELVGVRRKGKVEPDCSYLVYHSDRAVTVYSLNSGAEIQRYEIPQEFYMPYTITVIPASDFNLLAITDWSGASLVILNRATSTYTELNVEFDTKRLGVAGRVSFSPDGRYLAIGMQWGMRVWDLQNLPANVEDRLPIYRIESPVRLGNWRFISNTVLELGSGENAVHFDLTTGQFIP